MFEKNHQRLIDACYPPKAPKDTTALPSAVSNEVSKLTFYAAGRPKKLPKVAEAVLHRAQAFAPATPGFKGTAGLAVSVDVMRALVSEARAELGCFGAEALEVAELGLRQQGSLDLFARAASLVSQTLWTMSAVRLHADWMVLVQFHGVVTFSSGSSLAVGDRTGHAYLTCLAILADTASQTKADRK